MFNSMLLTINLIQFTLRRKNQRVERLKMAPSLAFYQETVTA